MSVRSAKPTGAEMARREDGGRGLTKLYLFLLQISWLEALNHSID